MDENDEDKDEYEVEGRIISAAKIVVKDADDVPVVHVNSSPHDKILFPATFYQFASPRLQKRITAVLSLASTQIW
ncbi:hypothetical protein [Parasitella parasitica]|uniref:Uncharacterized protein n=1 Tax=Parasitella parasitica TaxID=35722 RepID=A0A0B7MWV2_9FUNG|nr:hypothetical protein [Parasitella parasitica]